MIKNKINIFTSILLMICVLSTQIIFLDSVLANNSLVAAKPVEITEFVQSNFSGGAGQNSVSASGSTTNKYSKAEMPENLAINSSSVRLNINPTLDISSPTHNIVHQVEVQGPIWGIYKMNMFDGTTRWNAEIQGAPVNTVVGRFPTNLETGASMIDDTYFYVQPGEKQEASYAHGLYYGMKVTLKKSNVLSQIRFFLHNDDGRKYTGYMIRGSNDDVTYEDIAKVFNFNGNGWITVPVSNKNYKYLKFYFDGWKSSDYQEDENFNMISGDKGNIINMRELEIIDSLGNNVAKNWGDVMDARGPHHQGRLVDADAGNQYYHMVDTLGDIGYLNTIDLGESRPLSGVKFFLYNRDIRRYYGYQVLVSNDNVNWTTKIDYTGDNADPKGYVGPQNIKFSSIENWRYVKINGWKGGFSPDRERWDWAGDTKFYVTSIQPQTPYYYGGIESSILDFGDKREFLRINAGGNFDTFGKEIKIYVRTGDTSSFNKNYWSNWAEVMGNIPNYLQNKRYLQYKVLLLSRDSTQTPILENITISHKRYVQDMDTYTVSYSNDNHVPLESNITKPVESYRYNLGGLQTRENTIVKDVDNDGVVDLIMLQGGRILAKRWYRDDENLAVPYVDDIIWDTPNRGFSRIIGMHDFNNDGVEELLVVNEGAIGSIAIINIDTGNVLWSTEILGFRPNDNSRGAYRGIFIDDLEGDGYLEMIASGFSNQNSDAKTRMYSFKNGFTQTPRALVSDGGNLLWEKGAFMGNRHVNHIALGKFIPGTTFKQVLRTTEHSIIVYNAETGDEINTFKLPIPGNEPGSFDNYITYPNSLNGNENRFFDGLLSPYVHIFDGHINDVDKKSTYAETFQKNYIIFDLGTQRTFNQLKSYFENTSTRRQNNILWEGSNDWDVNSGEGTWTKISDWQLDNYGDYSDSRNCQGWCDTGTLGVSMNYRYLRLRGTGSPSYPWRGMLISEIDILMDGVSIKESIKDQATTYVYPWNATYHNTSMEYIDIDGDNIDEILMYNGRSSGRFYDWRQGWIGLLKFGNIGELNKTNWVWSDINSGFDGANLSASGFGYMSVDDIDNDGKKDVLVNRYSHDGVDRWSVQAYDIETGNKKTFKIKYRDQDRESIALLDGLDDNNYYYQNRCPEDGKNYTESEKNQALCEVVTIEFDNPVNVDKVDFKFFNGDTRSYYNYKIEATKDLVNWSSVTPTSTQLSTTPRYQNWQSNNITSDSYKAFRFYAGKSTANDTAHISKIRFFNGGTDITSSIKENAYVWKKSGILPSTAHSDSWIYGKLKEISGEYYIPMYLGQRHGFYKLNKDKTSNNNVYFDLVYNTNSKNIGGNSWFYAIKENFTHEVKRNNYNTSLDTPDIVPITDGSQGDVLVTNGYWVRLIEAVTGIEKGFFNYETVGQHNLIYFGDLGKDLGKGFIQSFGDGRTRIVSLSMIQELTTINTGNKFDNNIIVGDIDNKGYKSIVTVDGAGDVIHLDISKASPLVPPEVTRKGLRGNTIYALSDPDEQVIGSDQGKDFVLHTSYPLGKDSNGEFVWTRHIRPLTGWLYLAAGAKVGDILSKYYYTTGVSYYNQSDTNKSNIYYDMKNNIDKSRWQNHKGRISKRNNETGDIVWTKSYINKHYFHDSQWLPYDANNDGYDDIILNAHYHYPHIVSGKDGLILDVIRDTDIYNWSPTIVQLDDDPELELYGQTSTTKIKVVHPKEKYVDFSVEGESTWWRNSLNHGKMGIVDLEGDGEWEIFTQESDGRILIHGKNMDLKKSFYIYDGQISNNFIPGAGISNSITSIDIDGDGKQNLVISGNDGYIYALNPNVDFNISANLFGEGISKAILWKYKVGATTSRLAFADIRNRNKTDIIFSAGDGFLRVLTQAGVGKPTKVNDGPTSGVNAEFTQNITSIGANWTPVDGASGYIVKFVSDTGQEIVPETPVVAGDDGKIPTQINIKNIGLQVGRKYFAMVKAFDSGGVSEYTKSDGIEVVGFNISKKVRNASDPSSQFQDEITVGPGEMVQYRITVTNRTNRIAGGGKYNIENPLNPVKVSSCDGIQYCEDRAIVLEDYMPKGFTYIAGTTAVNGQSRANEMLLSNFVIDNTNTTTNLPTTAGSVLRWKLPENDLIQPYGGTLELTFTARAN